MAITPEEIMKKPEADLVVQHAVNRYNQGLYSLKLIQGLPGTGKSSVCFRTAELIEEAFKGKKKVTKKVIENLKTLAEFAMNAKEDEVWIGIVEEVSTLFPSRRAMAGENVDLARILDTIRKKKAILLANAPIWTSIDSHMRCMGTVYIETLKIYKTSKIVVSKMYKLQTNPGSGKTYLHSFSRNGRDVKRMYTRMPNLETWKAYELQKDIFMQKLYERIKLRAEKRETKENKELGIVDRKATPKPLTERELRVYNMRTNEKKTFKEMAKELDLSPSYIHGLWVKLNKKLGFSLEKSTNSLNNTTKEANNVSLVLPDGYNQPGCKDGA